MPSAPPRPATPEQIAAEAAAAAYARLSPQEQEALMQQRIEIMRSTTAGTGISGLTSNSELVTADNPWGVNPAALAIIRSAKGRTGLDSPPPTAPAMAAPAPYAAPSVGPAISLAPSAPPNNASIVNPNELAIIRGVNARKKTDASTEY